MFPVLSGMEDGRKRAMGEAIRISSAIMYPLAFMLIAYPAFIPSLLGEAYLPASTPIMILAAGFLLAPLVNGYTTYAYALGRYQEVIFIGLAGNLPRIILYTLLIGRLAEAGAAISFSLGFLSSLIAVIPLAKKAGYNLNIKETLKTLSIPLALCILTLALKPHPLLGNNTNPSRIIHHLHPAQNNIQKRLSKHSNSTTLKKSPNKPLTIPKTNPQNTLWRINPVIQSMK